MPNKGSTIFWSKYNFVAEVSPVLFIGVIGNLLGYFANTHYIKNPILFFDTAGTIFTALVLGPWYAAVVAVISNFVNGAHADSFFIFGIANIMIGVFVGYFHKGSIRLEFHDLQAIKSGFFSFIKLTLLVTFIATLYSVAVKVVVYTNSGLPLLLDKQYYLDWQSYTAGYGFSELSILLLADFAREGMDKSLTCAFTIVLFVFSGGLLFENKQGDFFKPGVCYTDSLSPCIFIFMYSFYLSLVSFLVPVIQLRNSSVPISWLTNANLVALQYLPIVLAVFAILYSNSDKKRYQRSDCGRDLRKRNRIARLKEGKYKNTLFDQAELLKLFEKKEFYGVIFTVLSWPMGKQLALNSVLLSILYFAAVSIILFLYLEKRRVVKRKFNSGMMFYENLFEALTNPGLSTLAQRTRLGIVKLLWSNNKLSYEASIPASSARHSSYLLCWKSEAETNCAVVVIENDSLISETVCLASEMDFLKGKKYATLFYISSKTQTRNKHFLNLRLAYPGISIVVLDNSKLFEIITSYVNESESDYLSELEGKSTQADYLAGNQKHWYSADCSDLSLLSIVRLLDKNAFVIDVGSGLGRYTIFSAVHGHTVLSIERDEGIYQNLLENIAELPQSENVTALNQDYLDYHPEYEADLVICAGVLQHAVSEEDLLRRLKFLMGLGDNIYIEKLTNMTFDGNKKTDRLEIDSDRFMQIVATVFDDANWFVIRLGGVDQRINVYHGGCRSFKHNFSEIHYDSLRLLISRKGHETVL